MLDWPLSALVKGPEHMILTPDCNKSCDKIPEGFFLLSKGSVSTVITEHAS